MHGQRLRCLQQPGAAASDQSSEMPSHLRGWAAPPCCWRLPISAGLTALRRRWCFGAVCSPGGRLGERPKTRLMRCGRPWSQRLPLLREQQAAGVT